MALGLGLEATYLAVATLFQLGLAAIVLSVRDARIERWAFALVILFGGLETAHFLAKATIGMGVPFPGIRIVDTVLLGTLAYLVAQLPTPLGGARGRRWARRGWIAFIVVTVVTNVAIAATAGPPGPALSDVSGNLRWFAFALTAGLGAVHLIPRFAELEPGPLRQQTILAGAGLLLSPYFVGAGRGFGRIQDPLRLVSGDPIGTGLQVLLIWFVAVGLARVMWPLLQGDRDRGCLLFVGLLGVGVTLGIASYVRSVAVIPQVAAFIVRPVLLAAAMLRYDMLRIPKRVREVSVPAAGVVGTMLLFLLGVISLSPEGVRSTSIDPLAGVTTAAILAAAGIWLNGSPLGAKLSEGFASEFDRLERYRLALERTRAGEDGEADLAALRERLGVSLDEHRVLHALLERRVEIPTSELTGAEPGDVVADRYEIERELGTGGVGRALAAWDRDAEEEVVLKEVLRPWEVGAEKRRAMLEREAEVARRIDEPTLARVDCIVERGPHAYLVREYVPGPTLDEVVEEEGALAPRRAAALAARLASGLQALHAEGLLHLDLKPGNVVCRGQHEPVLIDQGTVRAADEGGDGSLQATRTATLGGGSSTAVGTIAWMAPEQVLEASVDERTDVFTLGSLLHYVLTGRSHVALDGRSRFEVEDEIVHGEPPELDGPLGSLVEAMLARDPEDRPSSMQEVRSELRRRVVEASLPEDEQAPTHADHVPR